MRNWTQASRLIVATAVCAVYAAGCGASPGKDYRAAFNVIGRTTGVATPDDKFVVTPNSDTPYFAYLGSRAYLGARRRRRPRR